MDINFKYRLKAFLKQIDARFGLRNWFSTEPNIELENSSFLQGEKELDYGWVAGNSGKGPGLALDIGCAKSPVSSILNSLGYTVIGVDLRADITYKLNNFTVIQGDFNQVDLSDYYFDLIVLCSTVEHIGLAGRYDNQELPDGDLLAMMKVRYILKPSGICILTIPVGLDAVYSPWHRIYGRERLPKLLNAFTVNNKRYFVKQDFKIWCESNEETALTYGGSSNRYALGQYVLTSKNADE